MPTVFAEAKVNVNPKTPFKTRFKVLIAAVRHLITGRGMHLSSDIKIEFGEPGIFASAWMKKEGEAWKDWAVTFDGKTKALGYINGTVVD